MAFSIIFKNNESAKHVADKQLTTVMTLTGELKEECSLSNPTILIEWDSLPSFNYFTIPIFGRSYYKTDVVNVIGNLWNVSGKCDVLYSFKQYIKQQKAILMDSEQTAANPYVANDAYLSTVKTKTDIVAFPSGLPTEGQFVLITAGGVGTL